MRSSGDPGVLEPVRHVGAADARGVLSGAAPSASSSKSTSQSQETSRPSAWQIVDHDHASARSEAVRRRRASIRSTSLKPTGFLTSASVIVGRSTATRSIRPNAALNPDIASHDRLIGHARTARASGGGRPARCRRCRGRARRRRMRADASPGPRSPRAPAIDAVQVDVRARPTSRGGRASLQRGQRQSPRCET